MILVYPRFSAGICVVLKEDDVVGFIFRVYLLLVASGAQSSCIQCKHTVASQFLTFLIKHYCVLGFFLIVDVLFLAVFLHEGGFFFSAVLIHVLSWKLLHLS